MNEKFYESQYTHINLFYDIYPRELSYCTFYIFIVPSFLWRNAFGRKTPLSQHLKSDVSLSFTYTYIRQHLCNSIRSIARQYEHVRACFKTLST